VSDLTYDDVCMRVCIYYKFSEIHLYILILGSSQYSAIQNLTGYLTGINCKTLFIQLSKQPDFFFGGGGVATVADIVDIKIKNTCTVI
jgi:hypothetical protein